mmetsp:Transcript_65103/g.151210  ORF Transcript_65103/g.151210 Transcript_65103/m.151210 type:complete len:215 (-) Transcript_65103:69-713(-)
MLWVQVVLGEEPLDRDAADDALEGDKQPGDREEHHLHWVVAAHHAEEEGPAEPRVPRLHHVDDLCVGIAKPHLHCQIAVREGVAHAKNCEDRGYDLGLRDHGPDDVAKGAYQQGEATPASLQGNEPRRVSHGLLLLLPLLGRCRLLRDALRCSYLGRSLRPELLLLRFSSALLFQLVKLSEVKVAYGHELRARSADAPVALEAQCGHVRVVLAH